MLDEVLALDKKSLQAQLAVTSINHAEVAKTAERFQHILQANMDSAARTCHSDELFCSGSHKSGQLAEAGRNLATHLPASYRQWHEQSRNFYRQYAIEMLRLAAMFPETSSEIDRFSEVERDGFELPDRHFLLTFDDGPTASDGNTDLLLPLLDKGGVNAIFFLVGELLQARLQQQTPQALQVLYHNQCAGIHGWQHQSHAQWQKWQSSITDTRYLLQQIFKQDYVPLFRPPYGQRRSDGHDFFIKNNIAVTLWNIDSQDWNQQISAAQAGPRVLTLMLLWRRGVILFHDITPKAQTAVPWLLEQLGTAGVSWVDCHNYPSMAETDTHPLNLAD
jgi:peptidoglycan/xylan/chitin deacetylase (PgdA/CDA1 family)